MATYGTNFNDERENQKLGDEYRGKLTSYNRGTGLTNNEFIDIATSFGRYGVNDLDKSAEMARLSAIYANRTNGDVQQYADYIGKLERYGGDGITSINNAFAASKAAGLSENQFGEFLSGLERVFENGISKGFTKSTKEVTETYLLLSKLSDGHDMFTEKGMERYIKMSDSLSNATNLNSVSSFLAYNVVDNLIKKEGPKKLLGNNELNYIKDSGATWLNTMALLEKGDLNSDFLLGLRKEIQDTYGNDTASKVLTYKELFGLNYEGAIQMFNLQERLATSSKEDRASIETEIKDLEKNPEFKNAETRLADSLSILDRSIHDIAKGSFEIKNASLDLISGTVDKIYDAMVNPDKVVNDDYVKEGTEKATDYVLGKDVPNWNTFGGEAITNFNSIMSIATPEQKQALEYYLKNTKFTTEEYNKYEQTQRDLDKNYYGINTPDKLLAFLYYIDNLTKAIEKNTTELKQGVVIN